MKPLLTILMLAVCYTMHGQTYKVVAPTDGARQIIEKSLRENGYQVTDTASVMIIMSSNKKKKPSGSLTLVNSKKSAIANSMKLKGKDIEDLAFILASKELQAMILQGESR